VIAQIEIDVVDVHAAGVGQDVVLLAVVGDVDGAAPDWQKLIVEPMIAAASQDDAKKDDIDGVEILLTVNVAGKILDRDAMPSNRGHPVMQGIEGGRFKRSHMLV
jgi:hypothetical protein